MTDVLKFSYRNKILIMTLRSNVFIRMGSFMKVVGSLINVMAKASRSILISLFMMVTGLMMSDMVEVVLLLLITAT